MIVTSTVWRREYVNNQALHLGSTLAHRLRITDQQYNLSTGFEHSCYFFFLSRYVSSVVLCHDHVTHALCRLDSGLPEDSEWIQKQNKKKKTRLLTDISIMDT